MVIAFELLLPSFAWCSGLKFPFSALIFRVNVCLRVAMHANQFKMIEAHSTVLYDRFSCFGNGPFEALFVTRSLNHAVVCFLVVRYRRLDLLNYPTVQGDENRYSLPGRGRRGRRAGFHGGKDTAIPGVLRLVRGRLWRWGQVRVYLPTSASSYWFV